MPRVQPDKSALARAILDDAAESDGVMVMLDARRPGVIVPPEHATNRELILQLGRQLATPIPDLKIDSEGISGTLTFDQRPFFVKVPWKAIYAIFNASRSRSGVYVEDVPKDAICG
jgi:stringent starvation protein B